MLYSFLKLVCRDDWIPIQENDLYIYFRPLVTQTWAKYVYSATQLKTPKIGTECLNLNIYLST